MLLWLVLFKILDQQGLSNSPFSWSLHSGILHGLCLCCKGTSERLGWAGSSLTSSPPILPQPAFRQNIYSIRTAFGSDLLSKRGFILVSEETWHGPCKTCLFMVTTEIKRKPESSHSYFDGLILMIYHIYRCMAYIIVSVLLLHSIVFF